MLLLEKTFATEVQKDEVAEVQVEQAEREVGAAAEQGRSWGAVLHSPFGSDAVAASGGLPSGLDGLEPKVCVAEKIIMRLMAGLACESLTLESERVYARQEKRDPSELLK